MFFRQLNAPVHKKMVQIVSNLHHFLPINEWGDIGSRYLKSKLLTNLLIT